MRYWSKLFKFSYIDLIIQLKMRILSPFCLVFGQQNSSSIRNEISYSWFEAHSKLFGVYAQWLRFKSRSISASQ